MLLLGGLAAATLSAMGNVELEFQPRVPVFDANVALGRRHNRRVVVDTTDGLLEAMDRSGVERALVYSPFAEDFDTVDGNSLLLEMIAGQPRLVPQFVANPSTENMGDFSAEVSRRGVRSVRITPMAHSYPLTDWVVGPLLEWLELEGISLSIPVDEVDVAQLHDTAKAHPRLAVVLAEVHYRHVPWVLPLLRSVPNTYVEMSRFVIADGVARLMDAAGGERILFGSRFPDSSMGHQLYNLHTNGLDDSTLAAVCAGNLDRLLGLEK